jgi:major membrane immunogen (membrane-anchored lipoprotein)
VARIRPPLLTLALAAALLLTACGGSDKFTWRGTTENDTGINASGGTTVDVDIRKFEGIAPAYADTW